jgi:hypothetical protein
MTQADDVDTLMAAIAEVLREIATAVANANAPKLSPILHTAVPRLMKVPELYRTVEGKLSKSRANLLLHTLQGIVTMLQSDTEEHSLSQVVDDDEEMHSTFLKALVDLIPSVCDLELQLIAVRSITFMRLLSAVLYSQPLPKSGSVRLFLCGRRSRLRSTSVPVMRRPRKIF